MTNFVVKGLTVHDGVIFPWTEIVTAESEIEAKGLAIVAQLRGGLDLEWMDAGGEEQSVRAIASDLEDDFGTAHDAAISIFLSKYQGEGFIEDNNAYGQKVGYEIYEVSLL